MEDKNTQLPDRPQPGSPAWKGYSLAELEFMRNLSEVKQAMVLGELKAAFNSVKQQRSQAVGLFSRFSNIMVWFEYGMLAFRAIQRVRSIFGSKRRR